MKMSFVGGGNMASALVGGLLERMAGTPPDITVIDPVAAQRQALRARWPAVRVYEAAVAEAVEGAEVIVLAVKPQQMREVALGLAETLGHMQGSRAPLVISVAAGIRAIDLSRWLGGHRRIVRSMPNTPALIGRGVTGLYLFDPSQGEADRLVAESIMAAVGEVVWVDDEALIDAVTALSGSGPAYVFRFMEAIEQAGVALGLDAEQARRLTLATFSGAAELAMRSTEPPSVLRERVTSKGGTTAAALAVMEARDLTGLMRAALGAAAARGAEMGQAFGADAPQAGPTR